ncbi:MAG: phage tail protein [Betaproteobacteria bacterium]|nr:phage tail protein [Betaproteobacteria bacterium]
MNITTLSSDAAALCVTVAARARSIEAQRENGKAWATLSAQVGRDIDRSVDSMAKLRDALSSQAIDLSERAPLSRSLGAIEAAVREISGLAHGSVSIPRLAEFGKIFDAARRQFEAVVPGAAKLPQILNSPFSLPRSLPNAPGANSAHPHLLILSASNGATFYFGLSTAAFDKLRRKSEYQVACQERLTRRHAWQAVSKGGDTITVSGVIFPGWKGTSQQIEALRAIGIEMEPVTLTTGYGVVLGRWYLTEIEEEQEALLSDGAPRKQAFTLEFRRYGEDYQNL